MENKIINKETINQSCQNGFIEFLKSQKTLKINGNAISIVNPINQQGYYIVTPIYEIEKIFDELSEFGEAIITFNVDCQVSKRLENGEYSSIDIYSHNAQGTLYKKDDSLVFQIDSLFFREKGK